MNDLFLSGHVKTMKEAVDLGSIDGKWIQDACYKGNYAWPKGIPPFNSEECSSVLKSCLVILTTFSHLRAFAGVFCSFLATIRY